MFAKLLKGAPLHNTNAAKDHHHTGAVDYSNLKNMPSSIEGVSIEKKLLSSPTMLAIGGSSGIALNTSRKAAVAWKDMAEYQKKAFASGWSSSDHPNHVIWHELAHVKVKNDLSTTVNSSLTNLNSNNPTFKKLALKVSTYAAKNGHEFLAEVFAAKRSGRTLDDDVLKYYDFLGGPK